jgi:hypothetical protein
MKLKKKACTMGVINNRIEKHGEKEKVAFDIPLTLLLDPDELCALLDDKYAHKALFNTKGASAAPMFPQFDGFSLKDDLQAKGATFYIGNGSTDYEIEFTDVRLKGLFLSPIQGGETQLTFKLQVLPQMKHVTKLIDNQHCMLKLSVDKTNSIDKKKDKQQDLPLTKETNGSAAEATAP